MRRSGPGHPSNASVLYHSRVVGERPRVCVLVPLQGTTGQKRSVGQGGDEIAVGVVSLAAFLSGHIHNNVHDVGMFVFGLSAWTLALGVILRRSAGTPSAA